MLYLCIPTYNESATVGLVLWKIREVFQEFPREYELLVYNDGSTDATAETLTGYASVLPLTVLGSTERRGYAGALAALFQAASQRTRYARRDAVITLQGDFTDPPQAIPEFVRRFEGGADIVVGQWSETPPDSVPKPVRRLRRYARWALRPLARVPGIDDPFGTLRLYRVSVLRDALKSQRGQHLTRASGWAANVDVLRTCTPHARRTETLDVAPRYDLRMRDSRVRPIADAMAVFRYRPTRAEPATTG
jgi:glycosyltransferase involved in cell wall biosynthesis